MNADDEGPPEPVDVSADYTAEQKNAARHTAPRGTLDEQLYAVRVGDAEPVPSVIHVPRPDGYDQIEPYDDDQCSIPPAQGGDRG